MSPSEAYAKAKEILDRQGYDELARIWDAQMTEGERAWWLATCHVYGMGWATWAELQPRIQEQLRIIFARAAFRLNQIGITKLFAPLGDTHG